MLSPGQWYKEVPKGHAENLEYRLKLYRALHGNPSGQRGMLAMCRQDLLFYVNSFIWQYNPNNKGNEVGPFVTWDYQDEAFLEILQCIEDDEDFIIEKSREMGASWMCLIVMEWMWHFHAWKKFLAISRNAEAVDAEDPDSLFWKIDFMHRYQPRWLMPKGYEERKHRRGMYYGNPENGSTITGQASTGKAGVGGRATWMFVDEFSQIREDYEVLHRTSDTTGCRGFNFTHTDINNAAAELSRRVDIRKIQMHWTQHPRKKPGLYKVVDGKVQRLDDYKHDPNYNFVMDGSPTGGPKPGVRSPWYDAQCVRKGSSRAIAMDLDINPSGSMAQFYDALVIHQLRQQYACPAYWEGDVHIENGKAVLVRRPGGPLRLWCHLNSQGKPPEAPYGGGADLATGSGATNSCLVFINAWLGEKVLEYANPFIQPHELAPLAVALCWLFKNENGAGVYLAWEQQGPGLMFGKRVLELGYDNVYFRSAELPHSNKYVRSTNPGWYPAPESKRILLEDHRAALKTRRLTDRSDEALKECLSFRYNDRGDPEHSGEVGGDDPTGARGNHGDRVIATALAWKMAQTFESRQAIEVKEPWAHLKNPYNSLAFRKKMAEQEAEAS